MPGQNNTFCECKLAQNLTKFAPLSFHFPVDDFTAVRNTCMNDRASAVKLH